jgi:hypothetical protein
MKVRVDPATQKLEAEAWIQQPPSTRFYLQKGFAVRQALADRKEVSSHQDSAPDNSLFAKLGTPVEIEAQSPHELYVKYGGEIREVIWKCNLIKPELVELALYAAWFPLFQGWKEFTFELEISLPVGFLTVTNGNLDRQWEQDGRSFTSWKSTVQGVDMVILASPLLQKLEGKSGEKQVEVYYHKLSAGLMKSMQGRLMEAEKRLSGLYGPSQAKGALRLVYTPRTGQGYARIPLIIVSEERALSAMSEKYGKARIFRDNCHELAHFWWMFADPTTPEDWINEGLAEYSAYRITEELFGRGFAKMRKGEYLQNAKLNATSDAIAETESSSPDREVNRYDKTTLMFLEARQRFGKAALDRIFKSLYIRFSGTHDITTALFLEEVEKQMGKVAEAFFRETLYRKNKVESPAQPASK